MLSDEWLSRYGLLENFNASVTRTRTRTRTRTGTGTGTGTWTTEVTAIALCTSCSRAKKLVSNPACGGSNVIFTVTCFHIKFSMTVMKLPVLSVFSA